MARIIRDLSNFHQKLYRHAIDLFTAFGLYTFDEVLNMLEVVPQVESRRTELMKCKQTIPSWLSFHVGVESLLKAVLLKHEVLMIGKLKVTNKHMNLDKRASNYNQVMQVYIWPRSFVVHAKSWPWLQQQLKKKRVSCFYDMDLGTIGRCKTRLSELKKRDIISDDEGRCLSNAIDIFCDIRRNADMHTFSGFVVGGSINQDLDAVYLPMVNLLFDVYHRS